MCIGFELTCVDAYAERQLMGLAGRKFVEDNFSEEKVINEYIQILRPYGFTLPPVSAVK